METHDGLDLGDTYNGLYFSQAIEVYLHDDPAHAHMKARVKVVLNDAIVVNNIRILMIHDRIVIQFPSRQLASGMHIDTTHPINATAREWIAEAILAAYARELEYVRDWEERTRPTAVREAS